MGTFGLAFTGPFQKFQLRSNLHLGSRTLAPRLQKANHPCNATCPGDDRIALGQMQLEQASILGGFIANESAEMEEPYGEENECILVHQHSR